MDKKDIKIWCMNILLVLLVIICLIGMTNMKKGNISCPRFSNSTYDPSMPLPFTNKCFGVANYVEIDKQTGYREVKRGFIIR